jgi:hypothetical protein
LFFHFGWLAAVTSKNIHLTGKGFPLYNGRRLERACFCTYSLVAGPKNSQDFPLDKDFHLGAGSACST